MIFSATDKMRAADWNPKLGRASKEAKITAENRPMQSDQSVFPSLLSIANAMAKQMSIK